MAHGNLGIWCIKTKNGKYYYKKYCQTSGWFGLCLNKVKTYNSFNDAINELLKEPIRMTYLGYIPSELEVTEWKG